MGIVAAMTLALTPGGSRASFVEYNDRGTFLAAAGTVSTETFDEFPGGSLGAQFSLDGVHYSTVEPGWYVGPGGTFTSPPESPPNVLENEYGREVYLHFGGGSVNSFGLALIDQTDFPPTYSLEVFETDGTITPVTVMYPQGGANFLGFVEQTPGVGIAEVEAISSTYYDDVTHSAITPGDFPVYDPYVPEPASVILLGVGLAGVGLFSARLNRRSVPGPAS